MDGRGEDLHKMFAAGNEKYLHYVKSNYITSKNISYLIYSIYRKIFVVNQKYFPSIKIFRPT